MFSDIPGLYPTQSQKYHHHPIVTIRNISRRYSLGGRPTLSWEPLFHSKANRSQLCYMMAKIRRDLGWRGLLGAEVKYSEDWGGAVGFAHTITSERSQALGLSTGDGAPLGECGGWRSSPCLQRPSGILTGRTGTGGQRQRRGRFMWEPAELGRPIWGFSVGWAGLPSDGDREREEKEGKGHGPQATGGQDSFENPSSIVTGRKPNTHKCFPVPVFPWREERWQVIGRGWSWELRRPEHCHHHPKPGIRLHTHCSL